MGVRILLGNEMVLLRQALKVVLERHGFTVVAEASDGQQVLELARKYRAEMAILDIAMPRMNGVEAARQLKRVCPTIGVILLTMLHDDRHVLEALKEGVRGFVLKTQAVEDLVWAIEDVQRGGMYVGPGAVEAVRRSKRGLQPVFSETLSIRERQVLQLVAEGSSTKEIAVALGISVKTAGFHRTRLMTKLNIHETAGLVRYAIRNGVIHP